METAKQHELMQKREALCAKSRELSAEYDALCKKEEDYTCEEIWQIEKICREDPAINNRLQEIDRKLEMYEVFGDCFDAFYERLKAEYEIKPKNVVIRGKDRLEEFKRADEAKKHEVKCKRP